MRHYRIRLETVNMISNETETFTNETTDSFFNSVILIFFLIQKQAGERIIEIKKKSSIVIKTQFNTNNSTNKSTYIFLLEDVVEKKEKKCPGSTDRK
jgi:hypothetical protein